MTLSGALDYTFTDLGNAKRATKTTTIADKVTLPPHTTYHDFRVGSNYTPTDDNPTYLLLYDDASSSNISPDRIQSATFHLSITLSDIGDDNPAVGDAATAAISQTCSYKK